MEVDKINVRVDKKIHAKVTKHTKKSKQSIGGFYDLAVKEKLEKENNIQSDKK